MPRAKIFLVEIVTQSSLVELENSHERLVLEEERLTDPVRIVGAKSNISGGSRLQL